MNKAIAKEETLESLTNTKCPQLCQLINMLSDQKFSKIKNQKALITSLTKLYNIIGLYNVKESVAKQTIYLINKLNAGEQNLKMLNTVLMGNPGCGKSRHRTRPSYRATARSPQKLRIRATTTSNTTCAFCATGLPVA